MVWIQIDYFLICVQIVFNFLLSAVDDKDAASKEGVEKLNEIPVNSFSVYGATLRSR